ncbi:MAG: aspartate/glutamate racemase family protein [Candidatus Heimdallarchaeota archaeon]|nr:aspartate/glutamate racemase family protein [Candidatus Heimdallarchaeota archaeon]
MKVLGLLGGMSWESSLEYYRIINEEVKRRLGGTHSSHCIMYSVDFEEIERLQERGDWNRMTEILIGASKALERAGAECLVICTNTMHKMAGEMEKELSIPLLHIADATANVVKKQGITRIALLGTNYTMEQEFYKGRLVENHDLDVMIPDKGDRDEIHRIIYKELVLGKIHEKSKMIYRTIIDKLEKDGAEGVILGCTEIGLLIKQSDVNIPVFDTTEIHARAAVEFSLAEE